MRARVLALPLVLLAACGWRAGLSPPPLPSGGTPSIGVEIFDTNRERVLERDLEPQLHAWLSQAVSDLVSAPLVEPSRADYVVRGRIVEDRRRGGLRRPSTGIRRDALGAKPPASRRDLLETGVRIVVTAELVERRTGRVVSPAQTAGAWGGIAVSVDEEAAARERVLRNVAETLVLELFGPTRPQTASAARARSDGSEEDPAGDGR